MGWHKLFMKYGLGSPGFIARTMAKRYGRWKAVSPSTDEPTIIRNLFVNQIAAQTLWGGPSEYRYLKAHASAIDELLQQYPDLFSITLLSIIIEHQELLWPQAPNDTFDVLRQVMQEIFDTKAPGWRSQGVWSASAISCSLCKNVMRAPNPATSYVMLDSCDEPEFLCEECAIPLPMRAMAALGFFMGSSHSNSE
jgi:hypothetical protein